MAALRSGSEALAGARVRTVSHPYAQIARDHSLPGGRMWLAQALAAPADAQRASRLLAAYAGARRRLGEAPIAPSDEHARALASAGLESPVGWTCDEVGRAALLCAALEAEIGRAHV